jgi:hypothetical protein
VARQIDLICALQLVSAEGPLAAQIGGYRTSSLEQCQSQNVTAERQPLAPADYALLSVPGFGVRG